MVSPMKTLLILAVTGIHTAGVTSSKLVLPTTIHMGCGYKSRTLLTLKDVAKSFFLRLNFH